jgi:ketosteroid isomerase-like protein
VVAAKSLEQNLRALHQNVMVHMNELRRDMDPRSRLVSRARALAASAVTIVVLAPNIAADLPPANQSPLQQQVAATERAFAKTMADRDLTAFAHFISKEAVFVSGAKTLRGRQQVIDGWRKLYEGPSAPFSWEPQTVEVLDSGRLALSSGPVHDAAGKLIGRFTSIWRLEAPNTWHIVFDSGCEVCARCAAGAY